MIFREIPDDDFQRKSEYEICHFVGAFHLFHNKGQILGILNDPIPKIS